jgi:hypothetical protein
MTFHGWLSRCSQAPDSLVGAQHQSAQRRGGFTITAGAALLCALLAFGARAEQPPTGDSPAEPQSEAGALVAFQQALAERDYDRAYGYVLGWKKGDAKDAEDTFIELLRGVLETLAFGGHSTVADADVDTNELDASDWYRRDLMAQVPLDERFWTGCMMRKHQGELRSFKILVDFADQYRAAGQLFPNIFSRQKDCGGFHVTNDEDEAIFHGKYNDVYRLALPRAERGDDEAQFQIAVILLYAPKALFDLVPEPERRRSGMAWLRKAADADRHHAVELSSIYRWGLNGLPQDAEVAQCYKKARYGQVEVKTCRDMEVARGYLGYQ